MNSHTYPILVPTPEAATRIPAASAIVGNAPGDADGAYRVHFVPGNERAENLQAFEQKILVAAYNVRDHVARTNSTSFNADDVEVVGEIDLDGKTISIFDRAALAEWLSVDPESIAPFTDLDAARREVDAFRKNPATHAMKSMAR